MLCSKRQRQINENLLAATEALLGLVARLDKFLLAETELQALARARETALESFLIDKGKEARAVATKIEADVRRTEDRSETKYDREF